MIPQDPLTARSGGAEELARNDEQSCRVGNNPALHGARLPRGGVLRIGGSSGANEVEDLVENLDDA